MDLLIWQKAHQLILVNELKCGDVSELNLLLEEVSPLLEAYSQAVPDSDS